jgi:hypothetical protein
LEASRYLPEPEKGLGRSIGEIVQKISAGVSSVAVVAASGDVLLGVPAGIAADQVGKSLLGAVYHRGADRAWQTMQHADQRIKERDREGDERRANAIDGESADQTVEAAIKAAATSVERRKAHLIGSLLASAEYDADLPVADFLRFLKLLEALSWRQILALAYFADKERASERVLIAAGGDEGVGQIQPGLEAELAELGRGHELIGFVGEDGGVANPSNVWDGGQITAASIDKIGLTRLGQTLHRLAEVNREVAQKDLAQFVEAEIVG